MKWYEKLPKMAGADLVQAVKGKHLTAGVMMYNLATGAAVSGDS